MVQRKSIGKNPEQVLNDFILEKVASGVTSKTLEEYRSTLTMFICDQDFKHLNREYYNKYVADMLVCKKPVTVNHYIRILRVFMYYCMELKYIEDFKINVIKEQEPVKQLYSTDDIDRLLIKPKHTSTFTEWRNWTVVGLTMSSGARAGTIVSMKTTDIDLTTQEMVYRHEKNKKSSILPVSDTLKKMLMAYTQEFNLINFLFPSEDNTQLTVNGLRQGFEYYCNSRGVEYKGFHTLRHTFAREFIVNGGNPFQLQKILDHQTLSMSQHYAHLYGNDLKGVINDFTPLSRVEVEEKIVRRK